MLAWLLQKNLEVNEISSYYHLDWQFSFYPPASEDEIVKVENYLEIVLPDDYRHFLLQSNGAHLFYETWNSESIRGLFIFGLDDIFTTNLVERHNDTEQKLRSIIFFAQYGRIASCGFNACHPNSIVYPVLDLYSLTDPINWQKKKIADSFSDWLTQIYNNVTCLHRIPEYWLPKPSSTSSALLLSQYSQSVTARYGEAVKLCLKAVHNLADGYFDQALEEFNLSLELYPECVPAYFERGNYWYKFKKYDHAIEDYSKAIKFNEKHAFAYYHRALALIEIEDYLSALDDLDQAIKLYSPAKFFMTRMLVENKLKNLQNDFRIPLQKDLSISFHSDYQSLESGVETLYQPVLNKLNRLAADRWLLYERRWLFLCKLSFQIRHL